MCFNQQEGVCWYRISCTYSWREKLTIRVVICAWLRVATNLKEYGLTREHLDNLSRISIYRDGFRAIPYGDESDDWLGSSLRRVKLPGEKYDNNQVVGRLEITQSSNHDLVDKTNREGLVENQSYFDMRDLTIGAVTILETESLEERSKMKKAPEGGSF